MGTQNQKRETFLRRRSRDKKNYEIFSKQLFFDYAVLRKKKVKKKNKVKKKKATKKKREEEK